jgi:signal transduction histidine kinase
VESNVEETHETIIAITIITIAFFVLLFTGFILLNRKISGSLWEPFYQALQKVKEFELNEQKGVQFDKTNIIEFAALNSSLERLISKDIATFKEQKEFTENASHELQTPLAVIQSKLDLLLQSSELTAEQSKIIEDVEKALGRMSRINRNLLLLAKIGNSQFPEKEIIDINELVTEQVEMLSEHIVSKNLTLEKLLSKKTVITANRTLAETLVSNLLTNAIRYSVKGSRIVVKVSDNALTVSNPGEEMLDKEKLFKRFSSQSFDSNGSGLGLAIVRQICRRYQWKEEYSFENKIHCFTVKL